MGFDATFVRTREGDFSLFRSGFANIYDSFGWLRY
jgi:hypothetical protein